MIFLLSLGLFGCYKDFQELSEIDLNEIPFENPDLQANGAQVSTFTSELECPDGKPATFFAVYPDNPTTSHIAIVFHSGAFDYQDVENELGFHSPSHMTQRWSREKVWETLGMNIQTVEPSEVNSGALATALLDANVVQLYPANCWGDLWHNQTDETDNNYNLESFNRSGRTFAYWMTQLIQNPNFPGISGFQISQPFDAEQIYWIGLGNGGRAITELLQRGVEPPTAILLDSVPADLQPYRNQPLDFPKHNDVLDRIFVESCELGITEESDTFQENCYDPLLDSDNDGIPAGEDCDDNDDGIGLDEGQDDCAPKATNLTGITPMDDLSSFSLSQTEGNVERLAVLWSDGDTQIPYDSLSDALNVTEIDGWAETTWAYNTHSVGHIFSNRDINASRQIVDFLINGTPPSDMLFSDSNTQE